MRPGTVKRLFLAVLFLLLTPGIAGKLEASAEGWKFGDQLTGRDKEVYELFENNYSAIVNCSEVYGITLPLASPMTETEARSFTGFRAQQAFLLDHSELFWINFLSPGMSMEWNNESGAYLTSKVTFFSLNRYAGIRDEIPEAQAELAKAVAAVARCSGRYEKVKAAHDYVIRLTTYPRDLMPEPYHAVTGPLLGKYGHNGVCEAYAWLFDILCKANGIPCVILEGGNHAWNYVQMEDGKWYLVDTTWDDWDEISYDYFLVGMNSSIRGKKVKKTHNPATTADLYALNSAEPLAYPTLSKQAYPRKPAQMSKTKKLTSVKISGAAKQVKAGKKLKLKATVLPGDAANKKLKWSSSNTRYATVTQKGVVKTKKAGKGKTVKITAKATDGSGKKATVKIKIK